MAIRKQASVDLDTYRTLKAVEFCTGKSSSEVLGEALAVMLSADPALAARVERARKVAA